MKHRFIRCVHETIPSIKYGYLMKITGALELLCYQMESTAIWANAIVDFNDNKFVWQRKKNGEVERFLSGHLNTSLGNGIEQIAAIKGISFIQALEYSADRRMKGMMKCLEMCGTIYIQENGSYMTSAREIGKPVIREGMLFPDDEIFKRKAKIIQWPNGTHFYAKIGNVDVVVDGVQKWDTRAEAKKAIKIFRQNAVKG